MIEGVFRDGHPRVTLNLPGSAGSIRVTFIIDTGFDGDIALPDDIIQLINMQSAGSRARMLADGSIARCPCYEMLLEWNDDERPIEVLAIEGRPLLGTQLLAGHLLSIEFVEGGEVLAESL